MDYYNSHNKPAFPFIGEGMSGLSKIEYATLLLVSQNLTAGDSPEEVDEVIDWSEMVAKKLFGKIDSIADENASWSSGLDCV